MFEDLSDCSYEGNCRINDFLRNYMKTVRQTEKSEHKELNDDERDALLQSIVDLYGEQIKPILKMLHNKMRRNGCTEQAVTLYDIITNYDVQLSRLKNDLKMRHSGKKGI